MLSPRKRRVHQHNESRKEREQRKSEISCLESGFVYDMLLNDMIQELNEEDFMNKRNAVKE